MKNRLAFLVKGELIRLHKYGITSVSILVAFLWSVMLFFVNATVFDFILPMLIMIDSTMMALMFVGSVMFFEKSESTISTLLVTPVSNTELILSKLIANTIHNILSVFLLIIVFMILKDVQLNIFLMFIGVFVSTAVFTLGGIVFSYFAKDFLGLLMYVMVIMISLMIPYVLMMMDILSGPVWENIMMLNPIQAATELINGGLDGYEFTYKYFFSLGYLVVGGLLAYFLYALPKFQDYAVKQSGV